MLFWFLLQVDLKIERFVFDCFLVRNKEAVVV